MSKYRPYLTVDTETTGMNTEKSEVLELAVLPDLGQGSDDASIRSIGNEGIVNLTSFYAEPSASSMNKRLFDAILDKNVSKITPQQAFEMFFEAVRQTAIKGKEWDEANNKKGVLKVSLAGKNVPSFDKPILLNFFKRHNVSEKQIEELLSLINHRTIDIGSLYVVDFGYVPNLTEINALTGRAAVSHCAMDDCVDCVVAFRHKIYEKK